MSSEPCRTRKKSSVSSCLCQTNSPFTFTHHVIVVVGRDDAGVPVVVEAFELLAQVHGPLGVRCVQQQFTAEVAEDAEDHAVPPSSATSATSAVKMLFLLCNRSLMPNRINRRQPRRPQRREGTEHQPDERRRE